jgi:hypothetical protein
LSFCLWPVFVRSGAPSKILFLVRAVFNLQLPRLKNGKPAHRFTAFFIPSYSGFPTLPGIETPAFTVNPAAKPPLMDASKNSRIPQEPSVFLLASGSDFSAAGNHKAGISPGRTEKETEHD